jgi:hypothetical protein
MRAHHKPTFGVEIARASDKLIAHERQLLADCEDATELVGLPEKGYSPASKLRAVIAGGCNPVKLRREEYRADRAQPDLRRANGKGETAKTLIAPLAGLRNSSAAKLNAARGPSSNSHQKRMSGSVFACPGNQAFCGVIDPNRPAAGRKYFRRFWTHS